MRVWDGSRGHQTSEVQGDMLSRIRALFMGDCRESQESSQFLAGFGGLCSQIGRVKCLSNAKVRKKSNYMSTHPKE